MLVFNRLPVEIPVVDVVDVGANPIDGDPPYCGLLAAGAARVVGFDPNPRAIERLNGVKGPNETYLPHAIGDGRPCPRSDEFSVCPAP